MECRRVAASERAQRRCVALNAGAVLRAGRPRRYFDAARFFAAAPPDDFAGAFAAAPPDDFAGAFAARFSNSNPILPSG